LQNNNLNISVIGLGYVGLPLALELAKKFKVQAYDININRIKELRRGKDKNNETKPNNIKKIKKRINFTHEDKDLSQSNFYIITVPTPITEKNIPDLTYLKKATKMIGKILKKNDIVVYESTTYPGCTEEVCIPILEKYSKMKVINDFSCGYSPERINPGDTKNTLTKIDKIISSTDARSLKKIEYVYQSILKAKVIKVQTIKIAEGAKIIENTQRDLNIALINELMMLFNKLEINFDSVLKAANTKWNFLNFKPGLVGGHCIGVDPYYLAYKSKLVGFNPKITLSGRKINDYMPKYLVSLFIKRLKKKHNSIKRKKKILIMGLTFKENVKDIRNSKSFEVVNLLIKKGFNVECYDKNVIADEIKNFKKIILIRKLKRKYYDGVFILVPHKHIKDIGINKISELIKKEGTIIDFKNIFGNSSYKL
jgi:UDP-N-acetyl-D-glucosamine/UDP-N-acetyl-D-galactosamine dehydrogenase